MILNTLKNIIKILDNTETKKQIYLITISACQKNLQTDYNDRIENAVEKIRVPVASQDIKKDQTITTDMIEVVSLDKDEVSSDDITVAAKVVGKKALTSISKGSFFKENNISD